MILELILWMLIAAVIGFLLGMMYAYGGCE